MYIDRCYFINKWLWLPNNHKGDTEIEEETKNAIRKHCVYWIRGLERVTEVLTKGGPHCKWVNTILHRDHRKKIAGWWNL